MGPKKDSKTIPPPFSSNTNKNQERSFVEIKKLIESTSASIEKRLDSVELQIKNQSEDLIDLIRKVEITATKAINIAESNLSKIKNNTDKIENNDFPIDQLKNQISALSEEFMVMKLDIEDMKNRILRKTLIFKNIPQTKNREYWDKSKDILTKEIRSLMPTVEETVIRDKTERAHRSRENEYSKNPAIIAKFNDWQFTESIKTSLIRAKSQICVSQIYSPALTKRRNEAMKMRKDPNIQAYVKFPAQLMIKREKKKEYSLYAEY